MKTNECIFKLRKLNEDVLDALGEAPGPHPVEDEEFLAAWSGGLLNAKQQDEFLNHLGACAACRRRLGELIQAGVVEIPAEGERPVRVATLGRGKNIRRWMAWGAVLAAGVLLAVGGVWWVRRPAADGPHQQLAAIEQTLAADPDAPVLSRLEEVLERELPPADAQNARVLLEGVVYREARRALRERRFDEVRALIGRVGRAGIDSGRLRNLAFQAGRHDAAEVALAMLDRGSLLGYGYEPDGSNAAKSLRIVFDKATVRALEDARRGAGEPRNAAAVALQLNLGQLFLNTGQLEEAEVCFRRARQASPGDPQAALGLGMVAFEQEELPEARCWFQEVVRHDPDSLPGRINLAVVLERQGDRPQARALWRALTRQPLPDTVKAMIEAHLRTD
jgi:cytochrome c-type biogenesis protein CcmH/NrfG